MASFTIPSGTVSDGDRLSLVLLHGETHRAVSGTIRSFQQDGETRWEIVDGVETGSWPKTSVTERPFDAIGFLPENIYSIG